MIHRLHTIFLMKIVELMGRKYDLVTKVTEGTKGYRYLCGHVNPPRSI